MKIISCSLLLLALSLAVPAAHADSTAAFTLQSSNGVNDGGVYVNHHPGMAGYSQSSAIFATDPGFEPGEASFQTHDDALSLSTQFVLQPHNNWVAAGSPHRQVIGTIPEPNMLLMVCAGLIGVGFYARRKAAILD